MPRGYPGSRGPHGTLVRYYSQGCRCEVCRDAMRAYAGVKQSWAEHVAAVRAEAEARDNHGTESRYKTCRCAECREAARVARARRRRARGAA